MTQTHISEISLIAEFFSKLKKIYKFQPLIKFSRGRRYSCCKWWKGKESKKNIIATTLTMIKMKNFFSLLVLVG